jgi:hypothetical protein
MVTAGILFREKESGGKSHLGLRGHLDGKDREIRANDLTEMAVHTLILSFRLGVIITFEIEGLRHPEDIARAVIDTEFAALASLFNYSHLPPCDLNGLKIKWNTPVFHLNSIACHSNNHPGIRLQKNIIAVCPTGIVSKISTKCKQFNRKS